MHLLFYIVKSDDGEKLEWMCIRYAPKQSMHIYYFCSHCKLRNEMTKSLMFSVIT
jgi:hypothetical protein